MRSHVDVEITMGDGSIWRAEGEMRFVSPPPPPVEESIGPEIRVRRVGYSEAFWIHHSVAEPGDEIVEVRP